MALEGTNNLVFGAAHTVPLSDQKIVFNDKTRQAMGWPDSIRSMYDYRNRIPAIYNRMFQLSIISLCSDVEFFFKGLFELETMPCPKDRGFFQRFEQVISTLTKHGIDFSLLASEIAALTQAFRIRHMCIHNFGVVDEKFAAESSRPVTVGDVYMIGQEEYRPMFDGYVALLRHVDQWLVDE
jgi:hypothetical protein